MEFLALLIGAGVVAASPLVPGLRPVAKGAVAGSLLVVDKTKEVVAIAGEQWMDLIAEAQVERAAEAEARASTIETITIPLGDE